MVVGVGVLAHMFASGNVYTQANLVAVMARARAPVSIASTAYATERYLAARGYLLV